MKNLPLISDLNPYTFLSSDTLRALLIHTKLTKNNYDQWLTIFRGSLMSKWENSFIDRTIKCPTRGMLEFDDWMTINSLIVS